MWYRNKKYIRGNLIAFGVIGIALIIFFVNCFYVNNKKFEYVKGKRSLDYALELEVTKDWSEDAHGYKHGMQYDGKVSNYTLSTLKDWQIEIEFVEGCYLDSYWNGEAVFKDNRLVLTCKDYNRTVSPNSEQTFGFILYGPTLDENVVSAKVIFERQMKASEQPIFWFLIVAIVVVIAVDITIAVLGAKNRTLRKKQQEFLEIINQSFLTFANMIDAKDPYTEGHSHRVALYSKLIAGKMGLGRDEQWDIFYIALLHDIGKIGIPDAILKKTGKLTPEERAEIEKHVYIGGDILRHFNAIEGIESGARYHHERYDGKGYVSGLKGNEIPLYARIICVADAFDAMSSVRCYRSKLTMDVIEEELIRCSGSQFDPEIVPYILELIHEGSVPVEVDNDSLMMSLGEKY